MFVTNLRCILYFRIDGILRWGQTSTLSCHDDSWLIVTTHTSSVWNNDRRVTNFTTVNVHEKSSKLLDPFLDPPEDFLFAYDDIHVKDGKVRLKRKKRILIVFNLIGFYFH